MPIFRMTHRFPVEDIHKILEALKDQCIRIQGRPNKLRWGYFLKGTYNTREAYNLTFSHGETLHMDALNMIWHINPLPKISTFIWLVAHR